MLLTVRTYLWQMPSALRSHMWEKNMKAVRPVFAVALIATLPACSTASTPDAPLQTTTVTATASSTGDEMSETPTSAAQTPSYTGDTEPPPSWTEGVDDPTELQSPTTAGPAIGAEDRGRPIPLDRFIQDHGDWNANQFDIADQSGIQGFATETNQCMEDYAPTLEIRLGNHFQSLSFNVGMSNDGTVSSDQRAVVQVLGNGSVLEVRRVPFNKIQPVTVDVKNVNALKIRVYLDPEVENCGSGAAQIVVSDVKVS